MRTITTSTRRLLVTAVGASLALAPTAALAADTGSPAPSAVSVGSSTSTAPPWSFAPEARSSISTPAAGSTVPAGWVTIGGSDAHPYGFWLYVQGPGSAGTPGWEAGQHHVVPDSDGRWEVAVNLSVPGTYSASTDSSSISFTVR